MTPTPRPRRHDVDWLRVFATAVLFPFHTAKVFDVPPYYQIKNAELSAGLGTFTGVVHQWHMPLFFLLAGWSAVGSIAARGRDGFLRERVTKLFVPFCFGVVVLCPPLAWVDHLQKPGPHETFLAFLPTFFTRLDRFSWSHLWFLIYLFVFCCLYAPLLATLARRVPRADGGAAAPPWTIWLAIVPLAVVQATLRARWPGYQNLYDDWANFAYYSLFFLGGALLGANPALEAAVHAQRGRLALVAVVALGVLGRALDHGAVPPPDTARWVVFWTASATVGFAAVGAFLGFAARHLQRTNGALAWASEAAFPIYVLHQSAIVLLGVLVIQLPLGIAAKFWLLLAAAVATTLAVYELVVRRTPLLRRVLGMRPRRPPPPTAAPLPVTSRA